MSEGLYAARPWLSLYPPGTAGDITTEYASGLALFDAAVAENPDDVFLIYFDQSLTFAEVDRASRAVAVTLREHGFGDGDRLGLYVQNNPAFVIGLLAAWRAAAPPWRSTR